jgi:uncharacterized protein YndB with AHSA1/START domain
MSRKFEKTFVVAVPVERAWSAFTDPDELTKWQSPVYEIDPAPGGALRWQIPPWEPVDGLVHEVDENRLLRYDEDAGMHAGRTEVTVTFESVESGTRITITHAGFGDGADWQDQLEGHALGWTQSIADLVLYLEAGVVAERFFTPWHTTFGMELTESHAGLTVIDVAPGGFADLAGLAPGDVVLRIEGVPIYTRGEVWVMQFVHDPGRALHIEVARDGARVSSKGVLQPLAPAT